MSRILYSPHELRVVSVGGEVEGEGRSCQDITMMSTYDVIIMSSLVTFDY